MTEQAPVQWPQLAAIPFDGPFPQPLRVRQLARVDVPALRAAVEAWCPEVALQDPALLASSFYEEAAAFHGEESSVALRPVVVLAIDAPEGLAAYVVIAYEYRAQILMSRLQAVHPDWRGRGMERVLAEIAVHVGRAMSGVVAAYGLAELDDPAACADFEQLGFVLCGIFPNAGRRRMGASVRYVSKAIYARLLVAPEGLLWPQPEDLQPRTAKLMNFLHRGGAVDPGDHVPAMPVTLAPEVMAALAARPGGRDTWPDVELLLGTLQFPPGVVMRQLARADIPKIISLLPVWHPSLGTSVQGFLLTPEFYESQVALAGEVAYVQDRPAAAYVAEAEGELVLFYMVFFDEYPSRTIRGELGVVSPAYRRLNLATQLVLLWVFLARALGVDTLLGWATLSHRYTQLISERMGLELVGIFPAADRQAVAPGEVKYTFEAMYTASLVPAELSYSPSLSAMSERVATLARFVRGSSPASDAIKRHAGGGRGG